jgi:uncharacterized protein (TIGR03437 family)
MRAGIGPIIGTVIAVTWSAPCRAEDPQPRYAPAYSASSLVNSASNQPGPLAPNTIASLYGTELSFSTRALEATDVRNGQIPTLLPTTGVRVLVNSIAAQIYFVSPRQVNLLIPSIIATGPAELQLIVDGRAGPAVRFTVSEAAPSLYMQSEELAIAASVTGSVYTRQTPARPGDWVILYATGLGATKPSPGYGEIARAAAPLANMGEFQVLLDAKPVERGRVAYAGLAPGFAGLYQINLQLPEDVGADPEIRIQSAGVPSPTGVRLPVVR